MRLVTRVAGCTPGMFRRNHLRKVLGFGRVGGVTADAEHSSIEFFRLHCGRIVRMLGLGAVARFAGNALVHALAFYLQDLRMAPLAHLVAGVRDG